MKIELNHLAPYLPYGLKFEIHLVNPFDKDNKHIDELESLSFGENCITFTKSPDFYLEDPQYNESEVKPILRPLSDLTKEIEHNREKFVPIDEIKNINEDYYILESDQYIMRKRNPNTISTGYLDFDCLPYWIVEKLFEWHFDVFGLIEKELAIDINSLNK